MRKNIRPIFQKFCYLLWGITLVGFWNAQAQPSPEELKLIDAAVPTVASVQPKQTRKLLVFSRSWGYKHTAIPYGEAAIRAMAEKTDAFEVVFANEDDSVFEPDNLNQFDAVFFNNTNNEIFLPENFDRLSQSEKEGALTRDSQLKSSLVNFLKSGKGLVVIHAGVASFREWPEYGNIVGGRFDNHPWVEGSTVTLKVEDYSHPLTKAFGPEPFVITDEIYQFKEWDRGDLRVLYGIDTERTNTDNVPGVHRTDEDFALGWVKKYGDGRVFYSALGHQHDIYWNPVVMQHFLDGIQFALGDLEASADSLAR